MAIKNPYEVLGVKPTASEKEIKSAYRTLAKTLHPDLNPGNKQAEAKFKDLAGAYEILGNADMRKKYDRGELDEPGQYQPPPGQGPGTGGQRRYYHQSQGPGGARGYSSTFSADDFADLFGNMGGGLGGMGSRPRSGPIPGEDENYIMEIELSTAIKGGEREITLPGGKSLRVRIPAGVSDGSRLRFAGQGRQGLNGGAPGDAYVELRLRVSDLFHREGNHLEIELPISLQEAINGAELRVPTVDGPVLLRIPAGVSTGSRLRVKGRGIPIRETPGSRGDQFVRIKIVMPPVETAKGDTRGYEELKKLIAEWSTRHPYAPRSPDFEARMKEDPHGT